MASTALSHPRISDLAVTINEEQLPQEEVPVELVLRRSTHDFGAASSEKSTHLLAVVDRSVHVVEVASPLLQGLLQDALWFCSERIRKRRVQVSLEKVVHSPNQSPKLPDKANLKSTALSFVRTHCKFAVFRPVLLMKTLCRPIPQNQDARQHSDSELPTAVVGKREQKSHSTLPWISTWILLMSSAQVSILLFENTNNLVVATLLLVLSATGLLSERLAVFSKPVCLCALAGQALLLLCVMAIVDVSRVAANPIDVEAWRLLWVPRKEMQRAFGSGDALLMMFQNSIFASLGMTFLLGLSAFLLNKRPDKLARVLRATPRVFLACIFVLAAFSCLASFVPKSIFGENPSAALAYAYGDCHKPPVTTLTRKPNVVVVMIDSWRADLLSDETMPRTLEELRTGTQASMVQELKHHDSGAVNSDFSHIGFFYGLVGATRQHLEMFSRNPNITSWPLEVFRTNGYRLHRVGGFEDDFCWGIMKKCDLYQRAFDQVYTGDGLNEADYGARGAFNETLNLFQQWSSVKNKPPMFISTDLQNLHLPYNYEELPDVEYLKPILDDVIMKKPEKLVARSIQKEEKEHLQLLLRNRVKNAMRTLDVFLAQWLVDMRPFLDNTVIIITGDHGELLLDTDENLLSHAKNSPVDVQRAVPFFMLGPEDIVTSLSVTDTTVTCHPDVLPSLLEALGATFNERWTEEVGHHSHFHDMTTAALDPSTGFAYARNQGFKLLVDGDQRITIDNKRGKEEAYRLSDGSELSKAEVDEMMHKLKSLMRRTWPGWNSNTPVVREA